MKFNKNSGFTAQETMLVKQAVSSLTEPMTDTAYGTIPTNTTSTFGLDLPEPTKFVLGLEAKGGHLLITGSKGGSILVVMPTGTQGTVIIWDDGLLWRNDFGAKSPQLIYPSVTEAIHPLFGKPVKIQFNGITGVSSGNYKIQCK